MLSALGNQAIQHALTRPLIQRAPKTGDELLAMTVGEFAEHRKAGQMDWANATGLSDSLRNAIWKMIDEAFSRGCRRSTFARPRPRWPRARP